MKKKVEQERKMGEIIKTLKSKETDGEKKDRKQKEAQGEKKKEHL